MLCVLSSLAVAWQAAALTEDNQYQAIVQRNVFALKPPPPPPDPNAVPKVDPPNIKLQGITTILGRRQVLGKVLAKPPQQAKEQSFVLAEGEREGEVEIVSIDENSGTVKLKNHGSEFTLTMKDDAEKPPAGGTPVAFAAPGAPPAIPGMPAVPPPTAATYQANNATFAPKVPARPLRGGTEANPNAAGVNPGAFGGAQTPQNFTPTTPTLPPLPPEAQQVAIEVNREVYRQQGDHDRAKILPPTSMSQPAQPQPTQP